MTDVLSRRRLNRATLARQYLLERALTEAAQVSAFIAPQRDATLSSANHEKDFDQCASTSTTPYLGSDPRRISAQDH
ncbi:hypothetical protein [Microtetraspora malaysiensis]|uniref:hypothetical protein n=1 Tax=Microtetraspora malaysiensis TaxID=161358 RepID=UPI003D8BF6EE